MPKSEKVTIVNMMERPITINCSTYSDVKFESGREKGKTRGDLLERRRLFIEPGPHSMIFRMIGSARSVESARTSLRRHNLNMLNITQIVLILLSKERFINHEGHEEKQKLLENYFSFFKLLRGLRGKMQVI